MLHPLNHLSIHCTTPMATLLLSDRSSQDETNTLYTDVLVMDQPLVAHTPSSYRATPQATKTLSSLVAALTTLHQGILYLHVLSVYFIQEANILLPLTLKYSTRQSIKPNPIDLKLRRLRLFDDLTLFEFSQVVFVPIPPPAPPLSVN